MARQQRQKPTVYVVVDMEGVTGVVDPAVDTNATGKDFELHRRLMTAEVSAAVEGFLAGGAGRVLVADFHGDGKNLFLADLPPQVELIRGAFRPGSGRDGADGPVDALAVLGAHALAHTQDGVIAHTYTAGLEVAVDGEPQSEFSLLAAAWGERGVPAVLVSGDRAACAQARERCPRVRAVETKVGLSFRAARCLHPAVVRERVSKEAGCALRDRAALEPFTLVRGRSAEVRFDLALTHWADELSWVPGLRRAGPRALEFTVRSAGEILDLVYGACMLRPAR